MLRAVPMMILRAASRFAAFRSGILILAISSTCFMVTVPTLFRLGSDEPFAIPTARFRSTAAGGVLVMKAVGAIRKNGDDHRNDEAFVFAGPRVEGLAEIHDVDAVLTERRPNGRGRRGLTCRYLKLDLTDDFFHVY